MLIIVSYDSILLMRLHLGWDAVSSLRHFPG